MEEIPPKRLGQKVVLDFKQQVESDMALPFDDKYVLNTYRLDDDRYKFVAEPKTVDVPRREFTYNASRNQFSEA